MAINAYNFVRQICTKTLEGTLKWEKTAEDGVFQAIVADYILRFSVYREDRGDIYTLALHGEDGILMDSYTDEDFDQGESGESDSMYNYMGSAYRAARQQALGVSDAMKKILDNLDNS